MSSKKEWAKKNKIKQEVILVPYYERKCDIVNPKNNILIDDSLKNLEEWESEGGIPIFFDIDDDNIDSWGIPNTMGYKRVLTLEFFTKKEYYKDNEE